MKVILYIYEIIYYFKPSQTDDQHMHQPAENMKHHLSGATEPHMCHGTF
jgi:hypothetical protein